MPFMTKSFLDKSKVYDIYGLCFKHNNKRNNILSMFSFDNDDKIIDGYGNIILEYWYYKSGTYTLPNGYTSADIFVVGGGGGGSSGQASQSSENAGVWGGYGGLGGGINMKTNITIKNKNIVVTIGGGGRGGYWSGNGISSNPYVNRYPSTSGGGSSIQIDGTTYSAGGGYGGELADYRGYTMGNIGATSFGDDPSRRKAENGANGKQLFLEKSSDVWFGGGGGGGYGYYTYYAGAYTTATSGGSAGSHGLGSIGGGGTGGGADLDTYYPEKHLYLYGGSAGSAGIVIVRLFGSKFRPDENNRKIKKIEVR